MLVIEPVTRALGAQVAGVDLREPLSDDVFGRIHRALTEHQVLFFRDQPLSEDQQRAFVSRFGALSRDAMAQLTGDTRDLMYVENTPDNPPGAADRWHTDIAFLAQPPAYGALSALVIPESGGDTLWVSLFGIYDALSPLMKAFCDDLRVLNRRAEGNLADTLIAAGQDGVARVKAMFPPVEHPLVRTHPISGRPALYLTASMDHVVGLHREESDALLRFLRSRMDDPNLQVRWRWRANDFVIWDQASTNHRALSDYHPQHRKMRRCTVEGGRPFHRKAV